MLSPGGARLATPKSRALTSESWTNSSKRSASKPDRVKHPATLPDRRASSAPATCAGSLVDIALEDVEDLRGGSQRTRRWREMDSNFRSRARRALVKSSDSP